MHGYVNVKKVRVLLAGFTVFFQFGCISLQEGTDEET